MYILADFAYKKPDWVKVLAKWEKTTQDLPSSPVNEDRLDILDSLKRNAIRDKEDGSGSKLQFLKKKYKDPKTNKDRKVVTGIAKVWNDTSDSIEVPYLVGNPKSQKDPRFKGALNSLDEKVGKRKIKIMGINEDIDNVYKKKFGSRFVE